LYELQPDARARKRQCGFPAGWREIFIVAEQAKAFIKAYLKC
jgi:hypothetical protein